MRQIVIAHDSEKDRRASVTQHNTPGIETERGIFITFEGGEGAGKTTHIRFLSEKLRQHGREVLCLREPGGTNIGEQLRAIVLDPGHDRMADETELLIYEAARAQIVAEVIQPAIARGAVVLCDRFVDSTIAYQVYGRGLSKDFVERANAFATQGVMPDRTILLATGGTARRGLVRATHRGGADRLELAGEAFHTRVNEGFLELAQMHGNRIRVVESASRKAATATAIFRELSDLFPWMADQVLCSEAFFAPLDARRDRMGRADLHETEGTSHLSPDMVTGEGSGMDEPHADQDR